jgi:hypothetical protein
VVLTLDADPTKRLTGTVTSVANVGEQRPNADAKVFEVKVIVQEADTTLRPGMTTGNAIETLTIEDALFVPLEAVNNEGGVPFVYRQSGGRVTKQEVLTGAMNDDEVVIVRGLDGDDRVLLLPPPDREQIALTRLPAGAPDSLPPPPPPAGGDTAVRAAPVPPPSR